jgi:NAD(P)-dependent dehydrogenase (short-subunit alcohol dehydrogenase family)
MWHMKTVVITGANAGIGFATAKYIAAQPDWSVILACRNAEKAGAAVQRIHQARAASSVSTLPLDLLSLQSVTDFVGALDKQDLPPLHGLVLNAGGINMKAKTLEYSGDGFERTFQLNFLGHFAVTNLLLGRMRAPARILFVSSDTHDPAATRMGKFAPPKYGPIEDAAYGQGIFAKMKPMERYGTAKMFAMMFALELDRRLRADGIKGITVNSWSPGVVPTTEFGNNVPSLQKKIMMFALTSPRFVSFMGSHLSTPDEAARALGGLVTETRFDGVSGRYFDGFKETLPSVESRDELKARTVWQEADALIRRPEREPSFTRREIAP